MKYNIFMTIGLMLGIVGVLAIGFAYAAPVGPSSVTDLGSSSYGGSSVAANVSAIAGNVTELNFDANVSTSTWQGYFGNVTGNIVLGNANNQSLYNWALTTPSGQIYATRDVTVPTWTSIRCANTTEIDTEDGALGVNQAVDSDSVNRTFFNTTSFNAFYVGSININTTQNCYATYLNDDTGVASSSFTEVLLSTSASMIYTGLITSPTTGFDGRSHQFQMLVGEDGHNGDTTATPYYFYLELR